GVCITVTGAPPRQGRFRDPSFLEACARTEALMAESPDPYWASGWASHRAPWLVRLGQLAEATSALAMAGPIVERAGVPRLTSLYQASRGAADAWVGHRVRARAAFREALRISERGEDVRTACFAVAGLCPLLVEEGRFAEALAETARSFRMARRLG